MYQTAIFDSLTAIAIRAAKLVPKIENRARFDGKSLIYDRPHGRKVASG
jgi:hypothetical protein